MLGSKRRGATAAGSTTLVSREATIKGDLHFSGNLEIEGQVRGSVIAEAGKDAMVRVVAAGRVEGEIRAPVVVINGTVEGAVYAARHLELAPNARVTGDVYYSIVEMAAGAEINGRLLHRAEGEPDRPAEPQLRVASAMHAAPGTPAGGEYPADARLAKAHSAKAPPAKPPPAKVD